MKTVFNNSSDVIHLFVQRSQDNARCSNVFFDRNKIYSYGYHYLLGEFISNKKGEEAIMINNLGYSSTTAKHISQLSMGSRQYRQFYKKDTDLKTVEYTIESNVKKLATARKKELYINPSVNLFKALNEYLVWSGDKEYKTNYWYKRIVKLMEVINGGDYAEYLAKEKKRIDAEAKKKN